MTKNGAYLDDITEEQLLSLTHLPTAQAAKVLKVGTTSFKRVCRLHGIHTWPYKSQNDPRRYTPEPKFPSHGSVGRAPEPPAPVEDETMRLIKIVSDDIVRVSDITMPINYAADKTSIASLVKTVKLSQTMRKTSGVSIFNDGVLLKLLERLTMDQAGRTAAVRDQHP